MTHADIMPIMCNTLAVYNQMCRTVCKKYELAQTALDILMFLANHPQYDTAKDIIKYRGIQANLVSTYVDMLVKKGLLRRETMQEDRRSIRLFCTEQATEIIKSGREIQRQFFEMVYAGVDPDNLITFHRVLEQFADNIIDAKENLKRG